VAAVAELGSLGDMRRPLRLAMAFLWLTVGYWTCSFVLHFAILLLPFARTGNGVSMSSGAGVHYLRFSGAPGDTVLAFVTESGDHGLSFSSTPSSGSSSGSRMEWANGYFELFVTAFFALISLPILTRLLRAKSPNQAMQRTAGRSDG
jgi:hypothetical protein